VRKLFCVLVILAVAAGVYYFFVVRKASTADAKTPISTAKVEKGAIKVAVASTGRVVSNLDVDIKCKASGEIITLPFDVSDKVEKDALLLELDPINEGRTKKQAEVSLSASMARLAVSQRNLEIAQLTLITDRERALASLDAARAQASDARVKAQRMKELLDKKLGSQEDYDTAATSAAQADSNLKIAQVSVDELKAEEESLELKRQDVKLAETQVESDQIALDIANDRLADTKVAAPISGVVTARNVEIGQIISSGISNVGGGTSLLTISDLSRMFVLASVDESDIGRVRLDQSVEITADAFPGKRFSGKVVRVAAKGVNLSNVVTFEVKIEVLDDAKGLLKPEMTANIDIILSEKSDILTVPNEAVYTKDRKRYVSIPGIEGATIDKEVTTGITDGSRTEIISGVSEGDTVVLQKAGSDSRWAASNQPGGPGGRMVFP